MPNWRFTINNNYIIIKSKIVSRCTFCRTTIFIGEEIKYFPEKKRAVHNEDCSDRKKSVIKGARSSGRTKGSVRLTSG